MTTVYLAWSASKQSRVTLGLHDWDAKPLPLLVSYYYLDAYRKKAGGLRPALTMLDSGAYSAWNCGKAIDIEALIEETKRPYWGESVALDVIGDGDGSLKNSLYMKARGSPAFPVFHIGEPFDLLMEYKREFPKVGLSCRFGEHVNVSFRWVGDCFARAWPHKFHSFGWVDERVLACYPFHSADSSTWNFGPAAFGQWQSYRFGGQRTQLPNLYKFHDLRGEVDYYLNMGRRLGKRWANTLSQLEATIHS